MAKGIIESKQIEEIKVSLKYDNELKKPYLVQIEASNGFSYTTDFKTQEEAKAKYQKEIKDFEERKDKNRKLEKK